jgi:hypothetical protein
MVTAPVDKEQANDHERASEKPEVAGGSGKQPLEPLFDTTGSSEVGEPLDKANQAEHGKYIPFQHRSFLVEVFLFIAARIA